MKKLFTLLFLASNILLWSQTEYIAYPASGRGVASTFVTDYHALGVNPANLGWQQYPGKKFTTGSSEFGFSLYSSALSKQDLRDNIWGVVKSGSLDTLSREEKIQTANDIAGSDMNFNMNYNAFGFSYQSPKFGGIAFSVRTTASWSSNFNSNLSELLFEGKFASYFDSLSYYNGTDTVTIANDGNMSADSSSNVISGQASVPLNLSELMDGSYLRLSWNREYHIGYGRKILDLDSNFTLYAGVGAKYIQGIGFFDFSAENGQLKLISSMSPGFNIDYGAAALSNPSAITASNASSFFRSSVGEGWGLDFGVNVTLFKKLHLAASVTNIGQMTYYGNVYEGTDTLLVSYSSDGLSDMNVSQSLPEMLEESGLIKINGRESYTVKLPGTLRLGGSLELGKFAHVGLDLVAPFNDVPGSIDGFAWGVGGDVYLAKRILALSAGLTGGGGYDTQIPIGVNVRLKGGTYEFGVASKDMITFFTENSPTLSVAFGFARIRF